MSFHTDSESDNTKVAENDVENVLTIKHNRHIKHRIKKSVESMKWSSSSNKVMQRIQTTTPSSIA